MTTPIEHAHQLRPILRDLISPLPLHLRLSVLCAALCDEICNYPPRIRARMLQGVIFGLPPTLDTAEKDLRKRLANPT